MKENPWRLLFIGLLAVATVVVRLSDHMPNVTPVVAIALLAGASLSLPWSVAVPLSAMAVSDAFIGFASLPITVSVYGSFALAALLGRWLKRRRGPGRVVAASLASSILFYLITNGAVWWFSGLYARTLDGLVLCYYLAIPFFRNTMLGDMAYTGSLFLMARYVPALVSFFHNKIKSRCGILVAGSLNNINQIINFK